eukprot:6540842-Pyramimonas_sp.AAC.1
MGRFWVLLGAKFGVKKSTCKGLLINAALAGLEALVKGADPLSSSDLTELDAFVVRKGRAILGGAAERQGASGHTVSSSASEVLRRFGAGALFLNFRTRILKWLQRM